MTCSSCPLPGAARGAPLGQLLLASLMYAPTLTVTLEGRGGEVEACITTVSGHSVARFALPAEASVGDLQRQIWQIDEADGNHMWQYLPSSINVYMTPPDIELFLGATRLSHHAKLCTRPLGLRAAASWIASRMVCCLSWPNDDAVQLPATLTMRRAPGSPIINDLITAIDDLPHWSLHAAWIQESMQSARAALSSKAPTPADASFRTFEAMLKLDGLQDTWGLILQGPNNTGPPMRVMVQAFLDNFLPALDFI